MSVLKASEPESGQEIKFDEAVRMLEESIAAQVNGLDRLDDLEREKITYILKNIGDGAQAAGDSVEEILRTIEKYRVLLTMKGEQTRHLTGMPDPVSLAAPHIQHALPDESVSVHIQHDMQDEPVSAHIRHDLPDESALVHIQHEMPDETASVHIQYALPNQQVKASVVREPSSSRQGAAPGSFSVPRPIAPPLSANTACPYVPQPGLAGTARGIVSNQEDAFFGRTAVLRAFIPSADVAGQTIRYTVDGNDSSIRLYAAGRHIKITLPGSSGNGLLISGEGTVHMRMPNQTECTGKAAFTLAVQNTEDGPAFRMKIDSFDKCPAHDSGYVMIKLTQSDMCLRF